MRLEYEMQSGPKATSWTNYFDMTMVTWTELLENAHKHQESSFQSFLEKHPCMVPGAFSIDSSCGHAPFFYSLITQPKLHSRTPRIPDFLWIAKNSLFCYPTFIEIEHPSKKWFTRTGQQTAEFTQAQNQLSEWKQWFSDNGRSFVQELCPDAGPLQIKPHFVLIYGRTSEFKNSPTLNKKRSYLEREHETYMTFDRLLPDANAKDYFTSRIAGNKVVAKYCQPTFEIGPFNSGIFEKIDEVHEAISASDFPDPDRKRFLLDRLDYWKNFSQRKQPKYYNISDRE